MYGLSLTLFFGIFLLIFCGISIALYVLQGIGVYNMSRNIGLSKPWLSFIPFINSFSLGRIAKKYVKRDGSVSASFDICLLILQILTSILSIAFVVLLIRCTISLLGEVENAILNETMLTKESFMRYIPVIVLYFVTLGVALAYSITLLVALWRVYSIYDDTNATIYLVLSLFFNFLLPIFLFILRKKKPCFTYEERKNITYNFEIKEADDIEEQA